jgi:hypothetical protein
MGSSAGVAGADEVARSDQKLRGDTMKTAHEKNMEINSRLSHRGIDLSLNYIDTLRRAEMILHRWAELECGDGNDVQSWAIERDEKTNKPYLCFYPHQGDSHRCPIPDREAGALKRVASLCKEMGLYFFHQTDPRGSQLYISNEPLTGANYTDGIYVSS